MTRSRTVLLVLLAGLAVVLALYGPPPRATAGGNVLRVTSESPPDFLDPGMSYMVNGWETMLNVYDGLLTYKKAAGTAGAQIVPDLAEAMPTITDGGKTYTFHVRRGVLWGPPLKRQVEPSDIAYTFERDMKIPSQGAGFYTNIVGAQAVMDKTAPAISGIVADDAARTVVFHLLRPDATFLNVLAMPFAFAVPKGTPLTDMSHAGFVPATGPYMITEYTAGRRILLERNPHYHQWTVDTPPGNVDQIDIQIGVSPDNAVTLVKQGRADYMSSSGVLPRSKLPLLLKDATLKQQVHIAPAPTLSYIYMNVNFPPFDKPLARQAINWAIDRRAMVKLTGGMGDPTETILPPSMPGYHDHQYYPHQDLAKARALLAQAGVTPGPIDIWCRTNEPNPTLAVYLQGVLSQIGFSPTVKCVDASSYFTLVGNPKTHALIGFGNWGQDFPEGSNFIDVLLNGARIQPDHSNNLAFYHGADRQIEAANRMLDLGQRAKAWGALDAQIMHDAPWAPIYHGTYYFFRGARVEDFPNAMSPVYDVMFMNLKLKGQQPHMPSGAQAAALEAKAARIYAQGRARLAVGGGTDAGAGAGTGAIMGPVPAGATSVVSGGGADPATATATAQPVQLDARYRNSRMDAF